MSEKALVLLSGGLDSTTALAWAIDQYEASNVSALILEYGQKHLREVESAVDVCEFYGVERGYIELPREIWEDSDCTLLIGREDVAESTYAEQIAATSNQPIATSVPFRNGVFLSIAAAVAMSHECNHLIIGIHQNDNGAAYPDCSEDYHHYMSDAIYIGTAGQVIVDAPFLHWTKKAIVNWGLEMNVPYRLTWSCYKGGRYACGKCATCLDRKAAFKFNNVEDPIEYETEI